jgi:hypothetical protein
VGDDRGGRNDRDGTRRHDDLPISCVQPLGGDAAAALLMLEAPPLPVQGVGSGESGRSAWQDDVSLCPGPLLRLVAGAL